MNRSRVSNGAGLFVGDKPVDGRTATARRFKDIVSDLRNDLGGDPTTAQMQLIRRAAALSVMCEVTESKIATGEPVDTDEFVKLTGALLRTLSTLGLKRRARDITPDIDVDPHTSALLGAGRDAD